MKKGFTNAFWGFFSQIVTVLIGFFLPKLFMSVYGSETNGLLSSASQLLSYLALFEAGVGAATVQALYKPVADRDQGAINAIVSATNRYYRRTGLVYLLALLGGGAVYACTVTSSFSPVTVFCVVLLSGAGSVFHYYVYGKYSLFLQVSGRNYIVSRMNTVSTIFSNLLKIYLVSRGCSILLAQATQTFCYLLQGAGILFYTRRSFPWLNPKTEPNTAAISQKNSVLLHQIASVIFSNTDILVLTYFAGFATVSVYYVYNLIYNTVMNLLSSVVGSITYIFGNLYSSDRENYAAYHDLFEGGYLCVGMIVFSTIYICTLPFIRLYTAGISDVDYIDSLLPLLFLIMQVLNFSRGSSSSLVSIAGHFKKTQNRAILEMVINLTVSLALAKPLGMYGVLLGTIVALLYRTNDLIIYANRKILLRSPRRSYLRLALNVIIISLVVVCNKFYIHFSPRGYLHLVGFALMVGIVNLLLFGAANVLLEYKTLRVILSAWKQNRPGKNNAKG